MRIISLICFTLGGVLLLFAVKMWVADRNQLTTWTRGEAHVDSVRVVDVDRLLPYTLGGKGAQLALTYQAEGETLRGRFTDDVWARRDYMRAREDARDALARGTIQILIDPADPRHLSLHPDDAMYYYRDAWQLAALALGLLVLGGFARVRRA